MSTLMAELADAPKVVRIEGLVKSYQSRKVLDGFSLALRGGEHVAIIGASGSGKSTALRCIAGLEPFEAGKVEIADGALPHAPQVGFVSQKLNDLWDHFTVSQNVELALREVLRLPKTEATERAESLLRRLGLGHCLYAKPNNVSGGEYQRAKIARTLAVEPALLLMDEVTSALDPELVGELLDVIAELAAEGRTMVFVSHELLFVRRIANRVLFLHEGRIIEEGPPDQLFRSPQSAALVRFLERFTRWGAPL